MSATELWSPHAYCIHSRISERWEKP